MDMATVLAQKEEHDRDHRTLLVGGCVWCDWEFTDMEDQTRGV
jgi:hypothetical protein